ncbi:hypothetical protein L204_104569 [Cryptococcus depauperatus]
MVFIARRLLRATRGDMAAMPDVVTKHSLHVSRQLPELPRRQRRPTRVSFDYPFNAPHAKISFLSYEVNPSHLSILWRKA